MNQPLCNAPRHAISRLPAAAEINAAIRVQFAAVREQDSLQRSHYFAGRYENIYVPLDQVPALETVLRTARREAARFLGRVDDNFAVGFWFNEMGPGHVTLPHQHNEDDELLSAVYYVQVPPDSGDLLLGGDAGVRITPQAGMLVFFAPSLIHEVTQNNSDATRLSIGMNFGPPHASAET